MRALLIVASPLYSLGGGVRHCIAVAVAASQAGWGTEMLVGQRGRTFDAKSFIRTYAPGCQVRAHRGGTFTNLTRTFVGLLFHPALRSPDAAVYAPVPQSMGMAYLAFLLTGRQCQLVVGLQGRLIAEGLPGWKRRLYLAVLRRCLGDERVRVWAVTRHAAEETARELRLPRGWAAGVHILKNVAFSTGDAPWIEGTKDRPPADVVERRESGRLLILARLSREKGVETAIEAVRWLQPADYLRVCGTGPDVSRLVQLAKDLGVTDRVQFKGWTADSDEELRCAEILLIPSFEEGFPIVALEGLWAGCPIVASEVGGLKELHHDHSAPLEFFPPGDPRSLARAVERVRGRRAQVAMPRSLTWKAFSGAVTRGLAIQR